MFAILSSGLKSKFSLECKESEQVNGDLRHTPYKPFLNTTHSTLQICHPPESLQPKDGTIPVTVFNGSTNTRVSLSMKSSDTIGKLKQAYVMKKPHTSGSLNLVYNGKSVHADQILGELGVKPNATFLTYQRCTGG